MQERAYTFLFFAGGGEGGQFEMMIVVAKNYEDEGTEK